MLPGFIRRSPLVPALLAGVSLAVTRTMADFTQATMIDSTIRWTIAYLIFGATYGVIVWYLVPTIVAWPRITMIGALSFGITHLLLVVVFTLVFDSYTLVPLGWPWSDLLAFTLLGGLGTATLARYMDMRDSQSYLGVGSFMVFGLGQLLDVAIRNRLFPLLNISPVTISIALTVHLVANFCCGLVIGLGLWLLLTKRSRHLHALPNTA